MFKLNIEQTNRHITLHCNDCMIEDTFLVCEDVSFIKYRTKSDGKEVTVDLTNRTFSHFNTKDIIAYHVEDIKE